MPTESELRALLQGGSTPPALDVEHIIRRARARRRPKRLAAGALGGLAALALVVPLAVGLGSGGPASVSDSSGGAAAPAHPEAADEATTFGDGASRSDDPYPGCHLPSWEGDAVPSGVELLVSQPAPGASLVLTLVNGSMSPLHGELAGAPILAVSDGERPLGWSEAAVSASTAPARVELAPGEERRFEVPFELTACSGATVTGEVGVEAGLAIVLDDGTTVVANSERTSVVVAAAP